MHVYFKKKLFFEICCEFFYHIDKQFKRVDSQKINFFFIRLTYTYASYECVFVEYMGTGCMNTDGPRQTREKHDVTEEQRNQCCDIFKRKSVRTISMRAL